MLMIGLIKELSKQLESSPRSGILSYFFCQDTLPTLNNAVSVLQGLIYLLVDQQKTLIRHLRKMYDSSGRQLFEDGNTFYALSAILSDMLHNSSLARVYLIVDALDECNSKLSKLLDLIARNTSKPSKVKWLMSSRNRSDIEERLRPKSLCKQISLELNSCHISHTVNAFIDAKVSKLTERKAYKPKLREKIRSYLYEKADRTFLWVALVCKELEGVQVRRTLSVLEKFPLGLQPLYERMMEQIIHLKDPKDFESCRRILSSVTLAYRPIHLKELVAIAGLEESPDDLESLNELVDLCGSFLTVREETVYFIHQSAKDYFSTSKGAQIFPSGQKQAHKDLADDCIRLMSNKLRRDICDLHSPGALAEEVHSDQIEQRLPAEVQYACQY
jgi:NACHT domain